jgi:nucleotide sugar dehydrogenase
MKPEDIDSAEKRGKYAVSIIGCDPIGIFQSCLFAEAGFKVICADADQTIVNLLAKGKAPYLQHETEVKLKGLLKTGQLNATSDIKAAVSQSDIIVVTTQAKVDRKKKADYSEMERTCKLIGSNLRRGSLVIITSVTGLGVVEGMLRETLENASGLKIGIDLGLAYSPIPTFEHTLETLACYQRIVAATDRASLNVSSTVLETVSKNGIRKVASVKTAEAAILFEAAYKDTDAALANELALFCEKAGVDYIEIQRLARAGGCLISSPTLLGGGPQEETCLLLEDAENLNTKLRTTSVAMEINEETARHAINLIKEALRNCGKTLRRAQISVLGISQTPNMKGPLRKILKELIKTLEARGVKLGLYDPYFSDLQTAETQRLLKKTLTEAIEGTDCIIIVTGHDQFKRLNLNRLKLMMKVPAAIVDLEGILEPDKVEKEGFIYRGLGRGVWTR